MPVEIIAASAIISIETGKTMVRGQRLGTDKGAEKDRIDHRQQAVDAGQQDDRQRGPRKGQGDGAVRIGVAWIGHGFSRLGGSPPWRMRRGWPLLPITSG